MALVTEKELKALARMSQLALHGEEMQEIQHQVEDILTYAQRVKDIKHDIHPMQNTAINTYRSDIPLGCDRGLVLSQAPLTEEHYIVVPRILETPK